jgi:hypothetical protein
MYYRLYEVVMMDKIKTYEEYIMKTVVDNIYLLQKGVRSVYTEDIDPDYYSRVVDLVNDSKLNILSFNDIDSGMRNTYIYRYPFFKNIILGLEASFKENSTLDTTEKKVRDLVTSKCLGIVLGYRDRADRLKYFNSSLKLYELSMDDINIESDKSMGSYNYVKKIIGDIRNLDPDTERGWYVRDSKYVKYKASNLYKHNHAFVELVKENMKSMCDRMEGDYGIRVLYSSIDSRTRNMFMFAFPNQIDYWIVKQLVTSGYRGYAPFSKYVIANLLGFDDEYYNDFVIK